MFQLIFWLLIFYFCYFIKLFSFYRFHSLLMNVISTHLPFILGQRSPQGGLQYQGRLIESVKEYYIIYQKEITQSSFNMCDLVKEVVQIYSILGEFQFFPFSQCQKLINDFFQCMQCSLKCVKQQYQPIMAQLLSVWD